MPQFLHARSIQSLEGISVFSQTRRAVYVFSCPLRLFAIRRWGPFSGRSLSYLERHFQSPETSIRGLQKPLPERNLKQQVLLFEDIRQSLLPDTIDDRLCSPRLLTTGQETCCKCYGWSLSLTKSDRLVDNLLITLDHHSKYRTHVAWLLVLVRKRTNEKLQKDARPSSELSQLTPFLPQPWTSCQPAR